MSKYTIDESNHERQRLLASVLNPFTEPYIKRLAPKRPGRWLDVGCGMGETTKMLAQFAPPGSACIGLDGDPALLEVAESQNWGKSQVSFQQGDATHMPFEDGSFDLVFTRFLLVHLPDPLAAIREMLRVSSPGGIVIAQEPDFAFQCCYPPCSAYDRVSELFSAVFPDSEMGRKLVHLFKEAGATLPEANASIGIEYNGTDVKRLYRMSIGAIKGPLMQKGLVSETEFDELMDEFRRVEEDPSVVVIGHPMISVWGER